MSRIPLSLSSKAGLPLAALAVIALAAVPWMVDAYGLSLAIGLLCNALLATAWGLFSGPTRHASLATVAFFGVGAYTVAALGEVLPWLAVLCIAAVLGCVLALLVGVSTLRLGGVHFVIFTFGLTELLRQLVTWYEVKVTRSIGRYVFLDITQEQIYWQLLALGAVLGLVGWLIGRSRLGFALRLVGGDEVVARHCGVNVTQTKLILFVVSALFMTLAGVIMAPRWTYLDPAIAFNPMISFQILIMALLGGANRLWGPVVGAVPLTLLFEYIGANFPNHFSILLGITFLAIVYLLPTGVTGLLEKLPTLLASKAKPTTNQEALR